MEIKVTIGLDERTHKVVNKLIDTLALMNTHALVLNANNPGADAQDNEWTEEEKQAVMREIAEEQAADMARRGLSPSNGSNDTDEETDAPKPKKANKPVSDDVAAPKKAKPKTTLEELRALAADVKTKTGDVSGVKGLLTEYSAKNISALPADVWDEFAEKLRELL